MIGVMTASSNSGAQCVEELVKAGAATRAIFRSESKAEAAKAKYGEKVEVAVADATVPGEALTGAFKGCKYAVVVTPDFDFAKDAELTGNMVRAAEEAGVSHVVFVGSWTVAEGTGIIARRFVPTERLLEESSLKWTALRSGYFAGNYALLFKQEDVYFPNVTIPPVDPKDIGRVAAAVCLDPDSDKHHKQHYDISGPDQLTTEQIVDKVAKATGRQFRYHAVPVANLAPPAPPLFLIELLRYIDLHGLPCSDVTLRLTGVHTSFDQYLADNVLAFSSS